MSSQIKVFGFYIYQFKSLTYTNLWLNDRTNFSNLINFKIYYLNNKNEKKKLQMNGSVKRILLTNVLEILIKVFKVKILNKKNLNF